MDLSSLNKKDTLKAIENDMKQYNTINETIKRHRKVFYISILLFQIKLKQYIDHDSFTVLL